ncbi:putative Late embryogenesis abundant protein [Helianthus annuus]|uniref:Late embryogenesis abundant protein, LEA_2 subgroup n=1 Tax=Helianthus annuus TaxID=4232 RepID=A0A251SR87_HELAN|nr:NDR1/HIN1-like protein 1 [Helianthus annuus]KAF5772905.1 putative Late embryogenesis abundant protein, LEA_2 subgroup [Helianthus annuus]KAJ0476465.1 putative Late embryogenesis abundant protein [Helianthus annuus]KAJ0480671.1 putative Late embryogenesis abundant protein [Helianthus annuus]KAJ0497292.1 putative Late embryogenesis abundant protein [Helianthus annuus]KAJ0663301.1 putative Late embryogenesis abundant protein [Helianthus annuus]
MSVKHCDHHGDKKKKLIKKILIGLAIFIGIALLVFLITWAILQPKKPKFILQDATIYNFNVSAPILLSSNFQVTINARNPNSKIGIYYDKLNVFATYHSQQITYFTVIQPVYQGHKDLNIWSPFVYGTNVPVAPYNGAALSQDQSNGAIALVIKINGRVRWKVGSFISGRYHLHVTCPAYIPFGNKNSGIAGVVTGVKYQLAQKCSVSV